MSLDSKNRSIRDEIVEHLEHCITDLKSEIKRLQKRHPDCNQLEHILKDLDSINPSAYSTTDDYFDSPGYSLGSVRDELEMFKDSMESQKVRDSREDIEDILMDGGRPSVGDLRGASWY